MSPFDAEYFHIVEPKMTKFAILFYAVLLVAGCNRTRTTPAVESESEMKLEQQLDTLAQLGLKLNEGVTIDDLLYSFDRDEYESQPFDTILFVLGSEVERRPWGRNVCDRAWNFDVECIEGTGDYVTIVENLCRVAGMPTLITNVEDFVDIDDGKAWLKYDIDGKERKYTVPVDNDWAAQERLKP